MTSVTTQAIEEALKSETSPLLPVQVCKVVDMSGGCGSSFNIVIVTDKFDGVALLDRHRMIHTALGDHMPSIHALQLKCYTPDVYARLPVNE